MLTVKKYKVLIYYFWGVKLEKLTNSVSDNKKKSLLAKPWECEIGTNLRGRNQYTRSDGRFTEINADPGELFASSQYTNTHTQKTLQGVFWVAIVASIGRKIHL